MSLSKKKFDAFLSTRKKKKQSKPEKKRKNRQKKLKIKEKKKDVTVEKKKSLRKLDHPIAEFLETLPSKSLSILFVLR